MQSQPGIGVPMAAGRGFPGLELETQRGAVLEQQLEIFIPIRQVNLQ
jgi:hypothetical protein